MSAPDLQAERRWTLHEGQGEADWIEGPAFDNAQEVVPASFLDQALAERDRARGALFECAKVSGADISDGAPGWPPIERWAVEEVQQLRDDDDENEDFKAERDRLAEVAKELAGALKTLMDIERPYLEPGGFKASPSMYAAREALAHYESLRGGADG